MAAQLSFRLVLLVPGGILGQMYPLASTEHFCGAKKIPALYPRDYVPAAMDDGEKSGESNDSCQKAGGQTSRSAFCTRVLNHP